MTHAQASELLADAALDVLSVEEQAAVLAHAADCPECGPALAALRDATSQLAYTLPDAVAEPAARNRVRRRLLARASADLAIEQAGVATPDSRSGARTGRAQPADGGTASAPVAGDRTRAPAPGRPYGAGHSSHRSWLTSPVAAWSVAGIIGMAAVAIIAVMKSRAAIESRMVAMVHATDSVTIARIEDSLSKQTVTLRELTGQQVSVLRLTSAAPRAPWAWMFWNHETNRWTFVAHNLEAPPPGKTYQLWLVTAKAKISAGTFNPLPDGSAQLEATYQLARDSLRAIAVTQEPAGGVPQPTGSMVITATVGQ